jgi:5'-nucleotidase
MSKKKERPLILVTNDDGIFSGGIRALVEVASQYGDVVVVAPDKPQSGMGHAVTINGILRIQSVQFIENVKAWACTGTPVDCVKLSIYHVLGRKPDLLLSGINHGSNSSINVIYSGTMSAAIEGAMEGIPSIGFSLLDHAPDADFGASKHIASVLIEKMLLLGISQGTCLNVNIPKVSKEEIKGIRICRQAKAYWEEAFEYREDPNGRPYYWLTGEFKNHDKGEDTDEYALANQYVSVVPVQHDLTAYHAVAELQQWEL